HLMHGPFALDAVAMHGRMHELGVLHHVGQLEHHGDEEAGDEDHHPVPDQRRHHAREEHGKHDEDRHVAHLGGPEDDVLLQLHRLHPRVVGDLPGEVLLHVVVEHPEEVGEAVEEQTVDVLETMEPVVRLTLVHTYPG